MNRQRNEAGWTHTKRQRHDELMHLVQQMQQWLEADGASERVLGVLLLVIEGGTPAQPPMAHKAAIVYGEVGLRLLVEAADDALARVASTVQAGEEARREARVRGRKGGLIQ